jgi:riboflavin synthase
MMTEEKKKEVKPKIMSKLSTSLLMASLMANSNIIESFLPEPKKKKKCLLKECNNLTSHNGGYCCPEHCKLNRQKNFQ